MGISRKADSVDSVYQVVMYAIQTIEQLAQRIQSPMPRSALTIAEVVHLSKENSGENQKICQHIIDTIEQTNRYIEAVILNPLCLKTDNASESAVENVPFQLNFINKLDVFKAQQETIEEEISSSKTRAKVTEGSRQFTIQHMLDQFNTLLIHAQGSTLASIEQQEEQWCAKVKRSSENEKQAFQHFETLRQKARKQFQDFEQKMAKMASNLGLEEKPNEDVINISSEPVLQQRLSLTPPPLPRDRRGDPRKAQTQTTRDGGYITVESLKRSSNHDTYMEITTTLQSPYQEPEPQSNNRGNYQKPDYQEPQRDTNAITNPIYKNPDFFRSRSNSTNSTLSSRSGPYEDIPPNTDTYSHLANRRPRSGEYSHLNHDTPETEYNHLNLNNGTHQEEQYSHLNHPELPYSAPVYPVYVDQQEPIYAEPTLGDYEPYLLKTLRKKHRAMRRALTQPNPSDALTETRDTFFNTLSDAIQLIENVPYEQENHEHSQQALRAMQTQFYKQFYSMLEHISDEQTKKTIKQHYQRFSQHFMKTIEEIAQECQEHIILPPFTTVQPSAIIKCGTTTQPVVFEGAVARTHFREAITCTVTSPTSLFTYQFKAPSGGHATATTDHAPTLTEAQLQKVLSGDAIADGDPDTAAINHCLSSIISLIDMVKQARPDQPIYINNAPSKEWVEAAVLYAQTQGYAVHVTVPAFQTAFSDDAIRAIANNELSQFAQYLSQEKLVAHRNIGAEKIKEALESTITPAVPSTPLSRQNSSHS